MPVDTEQSQKLPQNKNQQKQTFLWIIFAVAVLILIGLVAYWYVSKRPETTSTGTHQQEDNDQNRDEAAGEQEDSQIEVETLSYTNPNYPDLSIPYNSTWTVSEREEQGDRPGAITTKVTFAKSDYTLEYSFVADSEFGGSYVCKLPGETEYVYLEGSWARIRTVTGYYYDGAAHIKGTPSWTQSVEEDCPASDYVTIDMANIITDTVIEIPAGAFGPGTGGGSYLALVDIKISFTGIENPKMIEEADSIVLNTKFE